MPGAGYHLSNQHMPGLQASAQLAEELDTLAQAAERHLLHDPPAQSGKTASFTDWGILGLQPTAMLYR